MDRRQGFKAVLTGTKQPVRFLEEKFEKNSKKFQKFRKILRKLADSRSKVGTFDVQQAPIEGDIVVPPDRALDSFVGERGILDQTNITALVSNPQAPVLAQRTPNVRLTPKQYLLEVVQTEPNQQMLPDQIMWFEAKRQQAAIALLPYLEPKKGVEDEAPDGETHEAWLIRVGARAR
jgi:hypothetical protein